MEDGACDTSATAPSNTSTTDNGCNGTVNAAFEDTEGLKTSDVKDGSQTESKRNDENNHSTNGELKSPTKDGLPPAEAVNLELVTMSPYTNSIPVKKESTELDMTDPYDEYFVPVNQHKKYIRGEKLYVTQDKRENLAGSKKKCCCGIAAVLVLGAAIAILVAVVLTQENGGLTESEGRNYDKAGYGGNLIITPPPRSPPSQPPPTTDMSQIYLKNVLEGELTIDNMEFTPGLSNSSSFEFTNVATSLEEEIKRALFDHQKLHYGASEISVKVIEFRPGSVIVTYRVGWRFKEGIHDPIDPIDTEMLRAKLQKHLKDNDGFLYNYRVPVHSIKSNRVIDGCQIDNNGCTKGCVYNTTTLRIICTCPFGYNLLEDGKTCVETDYMDTHAFDYPSSSHPPVEATSEPNHDQQWPLHEYTPEVNHDHMHHEHMPDTHFDDSPEETHPDNDPDTHDDHTSEMHHDHMPDMHHDHSSDSHQDHSPDSHQDHSPDSHQDHSSDSHQDHSSDSHHVNEYDIVHPGHVEETSPSTPSPETSSNISLESVQPSSETPIESPFEHHHVEPSHEQPMEPSHYPEQSFDNESHHYQVHEPSQEDTDNYAGIIPVATSEETKNQSMEPTEKPEEKEHVHEHNLGYLPEPTMIPPQDDVSSEHAVIPEDQGTDKHQEQVHSSETSSTAGPEVASEVPTNDFKDILLPPHVQEEFLPEYSTFPDDSQSSSVTENVDKLSSSESTPNDMLNVDTKSEQLETTNMENKNSPSESVSHSSNATTEMSKAETPNEVHDSTNSPEEEFVVPVHELNEGTSLLESNNNKNKTIVDESREELIDHMPEKEINKTMNEINNITLSTANEKSNGTEKSPNYSEVINDLHLIEGNPFETERLNELQASNESLAKSDNHLYSDTEKPFDHNVIETFREAKATDFTNTTAEGANSTHMEIVENGNQSNDMEKENPELSLIEHSSSLMPSESAIFVTPSPDMKNDTVEKESHENHDSIQEIPSMKPDLELQDMIKESPSTTPHSIDHDEAGLVKMDKEENVSPNIEDHVVTNVKEVEKEIIESLSSEKPEKSEHVEEIPSAGPTKEVEHVEETSSTGPTQETDINEQTEDDSKQSPKQEDAPEPTIFVTQPPGTSNLKNENESTSMKIDETPMISVTKMPDLMGPFPIEKEQIPEKSSENPKPYFLEDESNNLNSLEDDYEKETLKSKYQKQGKSKLLKNFNVKEIYPHHNSSDKNPEGTQSLNKEQSSEVSSTTSVAEDAKSSTPDSVSHILLDEGFTTINPLFTPKTESNNPSSSTTVKTEETTKAAVEYDQGLKSSDAFTTISPLFQSGSSQATTQMKTEEETTTAPLIFDLIENKKVDSNTSETDMVTSEPNNEVTEMAEEVKTELPPVVDLMSETTPASINPDKVSTESAVSNSDDQPSSSEKSNNKLENIMEEETTVSPSVTNISEKEKVNTSDDNSTTSVPTAAVSHPPEINDPVVQLLMNSSSMNSTLYSKCASGQWACLDGSGCIAPNSRCDSEKDCLDGSDEANCQEQGCPGNFQCLSGECLKRHLVCDSTPHCSDGSDEANCDEWKCNFDEMQCLPSSRKCIPSLWKCDNVAHCPMNEDEFGCKDSCSNDEFFCPEGWCIPLKQKCDGKPDCTKGEDEHNCPA